MSGHGGPVTVFEHCYSGHKNMDTGMQGCTAVSADDQYVCIATGPVIYLFDAKSLMMQSFAARRHPIVAVQVFRSFVLIAYESIIAVTSLEGINKDLDYFKETEA